MVAVGSYYCRKAGLVQRPINVKTAVAAESRSSADLRFKDGATQVQLLLQVSPVATIRSMPMALKSRTTLLALIVFWVWNIWSSALAQAPTPILRQEFTQRLVAAAIERTRHSVRYVSSYVRIPYPNGDVPADTGVCTDEIIRSYRAVGVDLQKEVHEDMLRNFAAYPNQKRWGLDHPDPNIDHRRVPNLMVFFQRNGETLPVTNRAADYSPGDLVVWDLGGGVPHIGLVVDQQARESGRYMVVHNIGAGPKMEDVLFDWKITGHYLYFGPGGSE